MRVPLSALPGVVALGLLAALPAAAADALRQITVTGSAEVQAVPDRATITAGVETQGATAGEALATNTKAMTEVFAALKAAGIAERDMQTSQLSISPVFEADGESGGGLQKVVGYQASNMVTVLSRDVPGLGALVDALAGAGANRLYGVSFDVADPRPAVDTARKAAVADARAKADLYAAAAGVKVGPVVTISEQGDMGGPMPFRAKAVMEAAPMAAGTVTLTADVTVVYGIE